MDVQAGSRQTAGMDLAAVRTELFIDGEWRPGDGLISVVNPADGSLVAEVANGTPDHARLALDAAVRAQDAWGRLAPRARAGLMHAAHRLMLEREDVIVRTMTLESGKPLTESRAEFRLSADFLLWFAEQVAHVHGTYATSSHGGFRVVVTHQPVGPSLLITPWNFPLLMIVRKAGAALAAGCTTITKTAQETPLTGALFVQVLQDAGFPKGVVNLIHTRDSSAISQNLLRDGRLRKVSFTGSTRVGSLLLALGAENIVNASMELGGDGPFLVLDDADIELAVDQAIICKFRNAGQACVAANRIIVDRKVERDFTERFVGKVKALTVGNGLDAVDVGPMISAKQRDRLYDTLNDLKRAGGAVLTGGRAVQRPGFFFEPTVVRFDGPNEALCNNELFAPIATIFAVDGVEQALDFANESRYGLASYVFTRDLTRAVAVGERLEFGMVGINRGIMADPAAPFGGTKASGIGREAGHDGIYEFLEQKYMALTVGEIGGAA
ncbi:NAD-dependent succinate-semialdehyde dehydrogenase [Prosthecomicrobium pneumaticum]|uniref:Succinate-semialdehyde dehydrogenase/glutarate-semialdehyde dehydrogenase n=1 Tax=Prosthecomicrobium pneumaticum TaxID=81895 RepID=A0A7W9CSY0_9HYPH|nr:NAD-dependent succinate-semialdehyde dehydrogenase [Prosthecomicrobium pneumaticum]MBB5751335.1 succinate-semialdehyde dehydrogenase/glutarate-semialdehyde dehydrogenase [Prosthecomicrobium pneumaticum]